MPLVNSAIQTEDLELLLPQAERNINSSLECSIPRTVYHPKLSTSLHSLKILRAKKEGCMSGKIRKIIFLMLCVLCFGWIVLGFMSSLCQESNFICSIAFLRSSNELPKYSYQSIAAIIEPTAGSSEEPIGVPLSQSMSKANLPSFDDVVDKDFQFNIENHDVMVFLHMQKTGGTTFGRHLVNDLELERDCVCHRRKKKRCTCLRPGKNSKETWLFSRYSTGWKCGLHADWTELTSCVDDVMNKIDDTGTEVSVKRRYFYITFLRNPIDRYLSEYRHVHRGATWKAARLFCHGRPATKSEVPPCYDMEEDWSDVSMQEFMSCPSNLANNRQTRMLADLTLVDCYNASTMTPEARDTVMLASAKRNLRQMSFFGLTELQEQSQYLFEETFNLKFNVRFEQYNNTIAKMSGRTIDSKSLRRIKQLNSLDLQLYDYAEKLLQKRYEQLKSSDTHFKEHINNMGNVAMSWDDIEKES